MYKWYIQNTLTKHTVKKIIKHLKPQNKLFCKSQLWIIFDILNTIVDGLMSYRVGRKKYCWGSIIRYFINTLYIYIKLKYILYLFSYYYIYFWVVK